MKHTSPDQWNMGSLMELATGYWKSALLSAGVELRIFDLLSDGPKTAADCADETSVETWHLTEVLDALTALGLLSKDLEHYALAAGADAFLNRKSPTCLLDALRFNMDLYPLWSRIPESVRAGAPALPPGSHLGDDPERTRRFAMGMHSRALGIAPGILPHLDLQQASTLLDVAAGPGTISRLLAEQYPKLLVTQFDLPAVQEVASELTATHTARDRIALHPGDYHHDELPHAFDAVLCCGVIHQENEESAAKLFQKIRNALRPNGVFWLVDMMLESDRIGPLFSNLFSINMMLTSPHGRVFTAAQLELLLRAAGWDNVTLLHSPHSPYWVLKATG